MAASNAEIGWGLAGYFMSLLLFIAPGVMMGINSVVKYAPFPYAVTASNCAIWLVYGIKQASQSAASAWTMEKVLNIGVPVINGAGLIMELVYIALFYIHSPADDRRRNQLTYVVIGGFLAFCLGGLSFLINDTLASWYCLLCGIAVYAVPLFDVLKVVLSRRARYMPPLPAAVASLCNGLVWCIFTKIRGDYYMFYPNLAGVVCAFVQLILHFTYGCKTGRLADFEDQDEADGLDEGLLGAGESFAPTFVANIKLLFSRDPFFV
ncbi:unnamed protein product [Alopecurus aequalis]